MLNFCTKFYSSWSHDTFNLCKQFNLKIFKSITSYPYIEIVKCRSLGPIKLMNALLGLNRAWEDFKLFTNFPELDFTKLQFVRNSEPRGPGMLADTPKWKRWQGPWSGLSLCPHSLLGFQCWWLIKSSATIIEIQELIIHAEAWRLLICTKSENLIIFPQLKYVLKSSFS